MEKCKYIQCKLIKPIDLACGIEWEQIAYIPQKYAEKGKILKIKSGVLWEDGWIVEKVYRRSETNIIPDTYIQIKAHKKRTGDSLPKMK